MKQRDNHDMPDAPPKVDDAEIFDSEKHASRFGQVRPERRFGFVPVDEAMSHGALFGEKVEPAARKRHAAAREGAAVSGGDADSEAESALKNAGSATRKTSRPDDPAPEDHDDDDVEEALKESFPASDPPFYAPGTAMPSYEDGPHSDESKKTR